MEIKTSVKALKNRIIKGILRERKSNSMTTISSFKYLWQPHNYRLKIPFKHILQKPIALKKLLFKLQESNYNINNLNYTERTKKLTLKKFKDTTIEVNPNSIIVIYSSKFWFLIEADKLKDINRVVDIRVKNIENTCLNAVREINSILRLKVSIEQRKWIRHEDSIKGDDFIDNIDKELIIHDTVFKKVYPTKVEFKDPFFVKNYINNRALEDIAPKIQKAIDKNTIQLKAWTKAVNLEIKNKRLHMKVLRNMDRTLKEIRNNLPKKRFNN